MTRTHFDIRRAIGQSAVATPEELHTPRIPSKRQPSTYFEQGRFMVRLDRTTKHHIQVTIAEKGTLFVAWPGGVRPGTSLTFTYNRFYHKTVWHQLLPLLLLDAVPVNWRPTYPDPPAPRNHNRKRAARLPRR